MQEVPTWKWSPYVEETSCSDKEPWLLGGPGDMMRWADERRGMGALDDAGRLSLLELAVRGDATHVSARYRISA
jgi:hypothetical protein